MGAMFDNVLDIARQDMDDGDLMRVIIRHEALDHAIVVPLRPANKMDASAIMEKVANVLQSEENLALDESFRGTYLNADDEKCITYSFLNVLVSK